MRSSSRRMAAALTAALLAAGAIPAPVSAVGTSTTVCEGNVTVNYSPALTAVPSPGAVTVTLSQTTLSCLGPVTLSATVSASGSDAAGASCAGPIALVGSGTISTNTVPQIGVTWAAAGTPLSQVWAFSDVTDVTPQVVAAGTAAWVPTLDGAGITPCTSGSVSAVTLTAVLVIAA